LAEEKKFIIRDTYQVLGRDLNTLSDFVICWTPDGARTDKERTGKAGGTGQASAIASYYSIPVFNLKRKEELQKVCNVLNINL